ncbi:MAG: hypothetical protein ABR529_07830 [Actinomycetota bacterium]
MSDKAEAPKKRRDTRLEAAGAEFLVLAHLLIEGIEAYKAYVNYPGYDLVAHNLAEDTTCRIQVKSRYYTSDRGFPIGDPNACDFVVYARLNRGYPRKPPDPRPPSLYVLPSNVVADHLRERKGWGTVMLLKDIPNGERFKEAWGQIRDFLRLPHPSG